MKKILKLPKLNLKDICLSAMLMAITVILAVYFTFRIGDQIKIPVKFISVFLSAFLLGPWIGGLCGTIGDIFNVLLTPTGAFLPQITAVEFLSGFIYGLFFYKQKTFGTGYILRSIGCALLMLLIDMLLTSAILVSIGNFPTFPVAFFFRLPAGIIKFVMQLLVLILGCKYLNWVRKIK